MLVGDIFITVYLRYFIPINSDLVLKNNVSRVTPLCHKSHPSNLNLSEIEKG